MNNSDMYNDLKKYLEKLASEKDILNEDIGVVYIRALLPEEAIGNPERTDFPILKGKEVMIEANFKGSKGQAFTDEPGSFSGTVKDLLGLPLVSNKDRAVFVASLNAILRYFGIVNNTVHCKNNEPELCAEKFADYIADNFNSPKIAFFGFQPAMLSKLKERFDIRLIDLDEDNIGKVKYGIKVLGPEYEEELLSWCDLVLVTGSTAANGTMYRYINTGKPLIFYGVSGVSICSILNLKRFCPYSQ
ncbi:MAG: Rossmann-like domain-containing protein [Caldisericaceae bacterium]